MNVGGDILRRFGPRRLPPADGQGSASLGAWVVAALLFLGGTAALLALAYAGFRSENAGRFAIVVSLTIIGAAILVAVIRWFAAPISENASFEMPDSGSFLDRAWGVRRMSLDGHPAKIAVVLLALLAADCALEVSAHWRWRPTVPIPSRRLYSMRGSGGPLRLLLAPPRSDASSGPPATGPGAGPPER